MTKGSGGGGGEKKPSMVLSFIEEMTEVGAGVILGHAASGILGATAIGALRGLKGNLFAQLFGGTRSKGDTAKDDDVSSAKKKYKDLIQASTGDDKLADMAEENLSNKIAIQLSNRPDKDQVLRQENERYEREVLKHLLSLTKRGLQETLAKLDATDRERFKRWYSLRQIPLRDDMTTTQKAETMALNTGRLTDQQRNLISIQKDHINSPETLEEMLNFSEDATERFNFLMDVLPKVTIAEHAGSALEAIVTGRGGQHPLVQSVEQSLKADAAKRIADLQKERNDPNRKRRNRL